MKFITALIIAATAISFAPSADAQSRGPPPHESVYEGLLPAGFEMSPASRPLDNITMRTQRAALIPSANFNAFTDNVTEYWATMDNGSWASDFSGMTAGNTQTMRDAGDPRAFADRVVDVLRPCFASVVVASDLAAARDQGADVYIIVDFWGGFRGIGFRYQTRAGIAVLDNELHEQLTIQHEGSVPNVQPRGFAPSRRDTFQAIANTLAAGLDVVAAPTLNDARARVCPVS